MKYKYAKYTVVPQYYEEELISEGTVVRSVTLTDRGENTRGSYGFDRWQGYSFSSSNGYSYTGTQFWAQLTTPGYIVLHNSGNECPYINNYEIGHTEDDVWVFDRIGYDYHSLVKLPTDDEYMFVVSLLTTTYSGTYTYTLNAVSREISHPAVAGTFIEYLSANEGTYPNNGVHTDGYWYKRLTADTTIWLKQNGEWKETTPYVKVDGVWKPCIANAKIDSRWLSTFEEE